MTVLKSNAKERHQSIESNALIIRVTFCRQDPSWSVSQMTSGRR